MRQVESWRSTPIELAESRGGVLAVSRLSDNLITTGVSPWPPPEIAQKTYGSRQARAFHGADRDVAESELGYYCDLQSLHSEDAVTWSVFGPLIYGSEASRLAFSAGMLSELGAAVDSVERARIWLWRRLPHPENLAPGGPEIDFGIQTDGALILGEAKWLSGLGAGQGRGGDKDQIQIRSEYIAKYGERVFPGVRQFIVLGVSPEGDLVAPGDRDLPGARLSLRNLAWEQVAGLPGIPCEEEVRHYITWKWELSKHP